MNPNRQEQKVFANTRTTFPGAENLAKNIVTYMLSWLRANPDLFGVFAHTFSDDFDIFNSDELCRRLKNFGSISSQSLEEHELI